MIVLDGVYDMYHVYCTANLDPKDTYDRGQRSVIPVWTLDGKDWVVQSVSIALI